MPTLLIDGDQTERQTWGALKDYIPHYERFWQLYVHPLRQSGSICLRANLDETVESMAVHNYSIYVSLARAHGELVQRHAEFRFFEEIYGHLFRAAEMAQKTVRKFDQMYVSCLRGPAKIPTKALANVRDRLSEYRNLVHDAILG